MSRTCNGFLIGDEVMRIRGEWAGMKTGMIDTIIDFKDNDTRLVLKNFKLIQGDTGRSQRNRRNKIAGHDPESFKLYKHSDPNSLEQVISQITKELLDV